MAAIGSDLVYVFSTALLLGVVCVGLWRRPDVDRVERATLLLAAGSVMALTGLLAVASLAFDFGECAYPSRQHPYFSSGRLLSAALIPFLLLFLRGLDWALPKTASERTRWLALGALVAVILWSELLVHLGVVASPYNLFHMWRGGA